MAKARPDLRRGRIVWATVRDHNGIAKQRPVVILTATDDISSNDAMQVMAITTTFPDPPPVGQVELPWHPQGNVATGLRRRSAAVLSWITEIQPRDVLRLHGDVPPKLMIRILDKLR